MSGKKMPPTLSMSPLWTCTHHKLTGLTTNQQPFQKRFLNVYMGTHMHVHIHGHRHVFIYTKSNTKAIPCIQTYRHANSHIHIYTPTCANIQLPSPMNSPATLQHTVLICSHSTFTYSLTHSANEHTNTYVKTQYILNSYTDIHTLTVRNTYVELTLLH